MKGIYVHPSSYAGSIRYRGKWVEHRFQVFYFILFCFVLSCVHKERMWEAPPCCQTWGLGTVLCSCLRNLPRRDECSEDSTWLVLTALRCWFHGSRIEKNLSQIYWLTRFALMHPQTQEHIAKLSPKYCPTCFVFQSWQGDWSPLLAYRSWPLYASWRAVYHTGSSNREDSVLIPVLQAMITHLVARVWVSGPVEGFSQKSHLGWPQ